MQSAPPGPASPVPPAPPAAPAPPRPRRLPPLQAAPQTLVFSESSDASSAEIWSSSVLVSTDAGEHNHGSSKLKLKNLVAYIWEHRYYPGHLLTIHRSGKYYAYTMKVNNKLNPGANSCMVRVVHVPSDKRVLLKGMKGEIQDLAFANIDAQVVLACIDEHGNVYVFNIELNPNEEHLRSSVVVEVINDVGMVGSYHRVSWCPYMPGPEPDDEEDEDLARLLVTTHASTARMWRMYGIVNGLEAGVKSVSASSLFANNTNNNLLVVSEHSDLIVEMTFAPDGTALATASADGYVMFFQVYMHNQTTPRCLHKWQPHEGKPLSCLYFLDDHKSNNVDLQFWKFAITGCDKNTCIKLWSCKSWNCLQTIMFTPTIGSELTPDTSMGFKAVLDSAANYLMLSDFKRKCLYVLYWARNADDTDAYCKSISEFLVPFPVLSFSIADAGVQAVKCVSSCSDPYHRINGEDGISPAVFDHDDDIEERSNGLHGGSDSEQENTCITKTLLKFYLIQPKALQEARLLFTPPPPHNHPADSPTYRDDSISMMTLVDVESEHVKMEPVNSILQQQSEQLKNLLMRAQTQPGSLMGQRPESPNSAPHAHQLNLMTPDAFSSPGKRDEEDPPISATPDVTNELPPPHLLLKVTPPAPPYELEEEAPPKYTSGDSSPSREVEEILCLKEHDYYKVALAEGPQTPAEPEPVPNGVYDDELYVTPEQSKTNLETTWPQITIAQINEANQRKASSDKSASQSINLSNVGDLSINGDDNDATSEVNKMAHRLEQFSLSSQDRGRLEAMEFKMDSLTELTNEQARLLRTMRAEIVDPRQAIEQALHSHSQHTALAIDNAFGDRWERVERAAASAGAAAGEAAGVAAARAASAVVTRTMEPLTRALQHELVSKLTATDQLLRENIEKLIHSKSLMDHLGNAVAQTLAGLVRDSFREAISQTLVPTMEKATNQLFKQINHTFQNGTKEFAANAEAASRLAAERGGAAAAESLRVALEQHTNTLTNFATITPQQITPVLHESIRGVLELEMGRWREQAATVLEMSRSQTPMTPRVAHTPHQIVDRQVQLSQVSSLLSAGDVNGAFQVALSASDLSLVVHACRAADPARVFSPTCQLKQHVLLSLVQQLAADMTADTQLKHRYLEEAIINLDPSNPVTREHMPVVVTELKKQLSNFLKSNPSHPLSRQIKMLLMATESLVKVNL